MSDSAPTQSHKATRYVKDLDKAHGLKDKQIGFRLSEEEDATVQKVLMHWAGISFANWVSYVMLRFVEAQRLEPLPLLSTRVLQARLWKPPTPTPHMRTCRVATRTQTLFMQYFSDKPISRMVRWALLDEATRALAGPSRAEKLDAQVQLRRSHFKLVEAYEPTGYIEFPTGGSK